MSAKKSLHSLYTVQFYATFVNLRISYDKKSGLKNKKAPKKSGLLLISLVILRALNGTLERIRTSDLPLRRRVFRGCFPYLFQSVTNQAKKIHRNYTVQLIQIGLIPSKSFINFQILLSISKLSKSLFSSSVGQYAPRLLVQFIGGFMTSTD